MNIRLYSGMKKRIPTGSVFVILFYQAACGLRFR